MYTMNLQWKDRSLRKNFLSEALNAFSLACGLDTILADEEGNVLLYTETKENEFCKYIKTTPKGKNDCIKSLRKGIKYCIKTKSPHIFQCHGNLTIIVVPVIINEQEYAIVCKNILRKEYQITFFTEVDELARANQIDKNTLKTYALKIPRYNDEQILAYCDLLHLLAKQITNKESGEIKKTKQSDTLKAIYQSADYIQDHFREKITIDGIAETVGLSSAYLSNVFSKTFGYTITEYLTYIRLEHAKIMMKKDGFTIGKASKECGFEDLSYFSRVFKRVEGISPREFKKNTSQ